MKTREKAEPASGHRSSLSQIWSCFRKGSLEIQRERVRDVNVLDRGGGVGMAGRADRLG